MLHYCNTPLADDTKYQELNLNLPLKARAILHLRMMRYYSHNPLKATGLNYGIIHANLKGMTQYDKESIERRSTFASVNEKPYFYQTRYCFGCDNLMRIDPLHCRTNSFAVPCCVYCVDEYHSTTQGNLSLYYPMEVADHNFSYEFAEALDSVAAELFNTSRLHL